MRGITLVIRNDYVMSIYNSKLWISDIDKIIETLPELKELEGKRIMITGCTGLICSAICDVLIRWNETHDDNIFILAAGRNKMRIENRFSPYDKEEWFTFIPYDATELGNHIEYSSDYIIHGAGNASPNKIIKEPVETMLSNFVGIKNLLDYARERGTKRILFISTSEVYGKKKCDRPSKVNEYGWIDILNSRNSYSIGKCAAETLCVSYYDEYNVDSVIVRPGHIYGPTAMESDNRVSSVWTHAVARGENIIMKSDGSQIRSYCYCLDGASAILKVLLKGETAHAYNISNPDSVINIRKMAEILTKSIGTDLKIELPTEMEKKGFNPMNNSSLDSSELLALGWKGIFDAECGFAHTVRILKEIE